MSYKVGRAPPGRDALFEGRRTHVHCPSQRGRIQEETGGPPPRLQESMIRGVRPACRKTRNERSLAEDSSRQPKGPQNATFLTKKKLGKTKKGGGGGRSLRKKEQAALDPSPIARRKQDGRRGTWKRENRRGRSRTSKGAHRGFADDRSLRKKERKEQGRP